MLDPGLEEAEAGGEWTRDKLGAFWAKLTDLATRDPKAYQAYIQRTLARARRVTPGFTLTLEPVGPGDVPTLLNLCQSKWIATSKGAEGNVNVIMGTVRPGQQGPARLPSKAPSSSYTLVDLVFGEDTMQSALKDVSYRQQLIQLALDCVEETYGIRLHLRPRHTQLDEYVGEYAWNDETGQPLTAEELRGEVKVMSPQELVDKLKQDQAGSGKSEQDGGGGGPTNPFPESILKELGSIHARLDQDQAASDAAGKPSSAAVQGVAATSSSPPPRARVLVEEIRPDPTWSWTPATPSKGPILCFQLPGVTSAAQLDISVHADERRVQVQCAALGYDLQVPVPVDLAPDLGQGRARFFKGKEFLHISYPLTT